MAKLSGNIIKTVVGAVVVAIVVVAGYFAFFSSTATKTVKAQFANAVGVYNGTPVRILGVDVGEVTGVHPGPQYVTITMTYDSKYRIREKDASAVEVANSLVSDRYINLSTLIGKDDPSPALASGATIPMSRTGGPAELDDIYAQLDKLSVALGPSGANAGGQSKGALSALLRVSAANLQGNGKALGQSITNLAAAAKTLSDHRNGLFGTVQNLQKFTATLKASDAQVRLFNEQLAQVAGDLASERSDLGAALQQLGLALNSVSGFVKNNAAKFHIDIQGLSNITSLLVRQKASLEETLAIAPVALANIVHAYNPSNGTLGTRSNLLSLTNLGVSPVQLLCTTATSIAGLSSIANLLKLNQVCNALSKTPASSSATKVASGATSTPLPAPAAAAIAQLTPADRSGLVDTVLNGGIPSGMLIGSSS